MKRLFFVLFACAMAWFSLPHASASHLAEAREKVVYSFCSRQDCADGSGPRGSLIDVGGVLYGTTQVGGITNYGVAFKFDPKTGSETVLHTFCSQPNCIDGAIPLGGLVAAGGILYGATQMGGAYNGGTVFAIDPSTGVETVFYSFGAGGGGITPTAFIEVNGTFYGTTTGARGATPFGTAFSLDLTSGKARVLHFFCSGPSCKDGSFPFGDLLYVKGTLYGTTFAGGRNKNAPGGFGTIYALNVNTYGFRTLHSFDGTDGALAEGGLMEVQGRLYGTTGEGGATGRGTVFGLDRKSGAETVLYSFCSQPDCTDGSFAQPGLIDIKGLLYGTTLQGGANCTINSPPGCGALFSIDPDTGTETVIYSFDNPKRGGHGRYPNPYLIEAPGGLYGTTWAGGAYNSGTLFVVGHP